MAGYDESEGRMIVKFNSGVYYEYLKVPQLVYERFKQAKSKGTFFSQNIRSLYNCSRIDAVD